MLPKTSSQTIRKEWRNKRNHIISTNGSGFISYKHHLITFKAHDFLFIPRDLSVRIAIHHSGEHAHTITVYKFANNNIESTPALMAYLQAIHEIEASTITTKPFIIEIINKAIESNIQHSSFEDSINKINQQNVIDMIRSNLKHRWTVEEVCCQLYISKATLYRMLKRCNLSFSDILTNERLDTAKRLLTQTNATIDQIAYECGFQNQSYFGKKFRYKFGVSPSGYRKAQK